MPDLPEDNAKAPAARQELKLPVPIAEAEEEARRSYVEFFTATIRNPNTRRAYSRAARQFFAWCESQGLSLEAIEPVAVSAYIEKLIQEKARPTVKQHLAAIRGLFDYMVTSQAIQFNPAAPVRGPKYSQKKGKTPVLSAEDARYFIESIDTGKVIGLRDRAIVGVMLYSFARVGTVVGMDVGDYFWSGRRRMSFRLQEKGGKDHEVPAHHKAQKYLDAYIICIMRPAPTGRLP